MVLMRLQEEKAKGATVLTPLATAKLSTAVCAGRLVAAAQRDESTSRNLFVSKIL